MSDRKAQQKYYPTHWDPSKGSLNTMLKQHPLRDRARKLDQGILIVRFELPYDIWCGGCDKHLGRGVRYNSEKSTVGNYFSTKILAFRCKCHLCDNWFEIRTDPKNHRYVVHSGARQKDETWEAGPESGTIKIVEEDEKVKLREDPLYRLEHLGQDEKKAQDDAPRMRDLVALTNSRTDHYALSRTLRTSFRERKKSEQSDSKYFREKGLSFVPLLPESSTDRKVASSVAFRTLDTAEEERTAKRREIRSSSIFGQSSSSSLSPSSRPPLLLGSSTSTSSPSLPSSRSSKTKQRKITSLAPKRAISKLASTAVAKKEKARALLLKSMKKGRVGGASAFRSLGKKLSK